MPGLRKYLVFCRFRKPSIRPLCNYSKSTAIALRKHFVDVVLPVMIFHFHKYTCNNIRNAKQYEGLSVSILFFPWLLYVKFMISVVEAYRLQRCNLDTCQHLSWRPLEDSSAAKSRYYCTATLDVCRGPGYASGLPKNHTWQNICRISEPWNSDI